MHANVRTIAFFDYLCKYSFSSRHIFIYVLILLLLRFLFSFSVTLANNSRLVSDLPEVN